VQLRIPDSNATETERASSLFLARMALAKAAGVFAILIVALLASPAAAELHFQRDYVGGTPAVKAGSSGDNSETVKSIPITRPGDARPRSVMTLPLIGSLYAGDRLEATAELQVSTTCLEPMRKCVGKRYGYSPRIKAHLVMTQRDVPGQIRVSRTQRLRCSQELPNRNHHCVIVASGGKFRVREPEIVCTCYLELILEAHHPRARRGNQLVIGSDSPKRVRGDRGRIYALVHSASSQGRPAPAPYVDGTRERRHARLRVGPRGTGGRPKVVVSLPLKGVRISDQFAIEAKLRMGIGHLPYNVLVKSQLILADSPRSTKSSRVAKRYSHASESQIGELNGFNCTQGRSAHPDPCMVRKRAMFPIDGPVDKGERLFVNLVASTAAVYGGRHRLQDQGRIRSASIRYERYNGIFSPRD
jgi:hypothetical protein